MIVIKKQVSPFEKVTPVFAWKLLKCRLELPNDEVSDTTEDHSSNADDKIIDTYSALIFPAVLLQSSYDQERTLPVCNRLF